MIFRGNWPRDPRDIPCPRCTLDGWPSTSVIRAKGVGAVLLTHARVLASGVANHVGVRALTATAIDDRALAFYLHHGFTRLEAGSRSVLLALRPS